MQPRQLVASYGEGSASHLIEPGSGMTSVSMSRAESDNSTAGLRVSTQPRIPIARKLSSTSVDDAASLDVAQDEAMQELTSKMEDSRTYAMQDMSAGSPRGKVRRAATSKVRPDRLHSAAGTIHRISTMVARRVANVSGTEEEVKPIRLADQEDVDMEEEDANQMDEAEFLKDSALLRGDNEASLERGYIEPQQTRLMGELEGRTLGIFGPNNPLRKTCSKILTYP